MIPEEIETRERSCWGGGSGKMENRERWGWVWGWNVDLQIKYHVSFPYFPLSITNTMLLKKKLYWFQGLIFASDRGFGGGFCYWALTHASGGWGKVLVVVVLGWVRWDLLGQRWRFYVVVSCFCFLGFSGFGRWKGMKVMKKMKNFWKTQKNVSFWMEIDGKPNLQTSVNVKDVFCNFLT